MINQLQGDIVFVFSDPGGAKPVLSMATAYKNGRKLVVSDRKYDFYTDFSEPVIELNQAITDYLIRFKPGAVVTGTSYTSSIEIEFIESAKKLGIPVYSFVDHWTSFLERFTRDNQATFPDEVWVIDERAKCLAVESSIPEHLVRVTGNPYHEFLAKWKPESAKEEFLGSLGISASVGSVVIVYAPDPLSNVGGSERFGFDEISATESLAAALENVRNVCCILKPHPNQQIDRIKALIPENWYVVPPSADAIALIYHSDFVIGFFSNFLIEASIMGKQVLRFFGGEIKNDPLEGMGVGSIVNRKELVKILQNGNK